MIIIMCIETFLCNIVIRNDTELQKEYNYYTIPAPNSTHHFNIIPSHLIHTCAPNECHTHLTYALTNIIYNLRYTTLPGYYSILVQMPQVDQQHMSAVRWDTVQTNNIIYYNHIRSLCGAKSRDQ